MNEEIHYLYLITRDDGETYIGVSKDPNRRKNQHYKSANGCSELNNRSFSMEILCAGSRECIYDLERKAVDLLKPSLNKAPGGRFAFNPSQGDTHPFSVLNSEVVLEIKQILINNRNTNLNEIANKYGVSRNCISNIANNRTWKHVGPSIPKRTCIENNSEFIEEVKDLWLNKRLTNSEIADKTGRSYSTIRRITGKFSKRALGLLGDKML